ncbi:MAG: hypothetical protein LBD73_00265 [Deferribacteraceae bacterium]|jgi:hypothetical protein|nr:hypothetical protein [Deferribacteraceae bacterium]
MNRAAQEANSRQAVVECTCKRGGSFAAWKYGTSLSNVKRWCKRYDGIRQSLAAR